MGTASSSELKNNYVDKTTFQQFQSSLPSQYASSNDISKIQNNISTLQHDFTPYITDGGNVCFNSGDVPLCFTPVISVKRNDNILQTTKIFIEQKPNNTNITHQFYRLNPNIIIHKLGLNNPVCISTSNDATANFIYSSDTKVLDYLMSSSDFKALNDRLDAIMDRITFGGINNQNSSSINPIFSLVGIESKNMIPLTEIEKQTIISAFTNYYKTNCNIPK